MAVNTNSMFDEADLYTHFIVNAYMKMPEQSLFSYLRYFPFEITDITIGYVGDHFMNHRGSYKWNIDQDL